MSMKTQDSPRRIYVRKNTPIVLFGGRTFSPPKGTSELDTKGEVTIEKLKSDGGKARIKVTQKLKGKPEVTETWRSVKIEREPRAAAAQ